MKFKKLTKQEIKKIEQEQEKNALQKEYVHYQRNVPVPKEINERAKISYDGKSLFIRLPAKIRDQFKIKQGQYMTFYAEIKNGKKGELKITIENA